MMPSRLGLSLVAVSVAVGSSVSAQPSRSSNLRSELDAVAAAPLQGIEPGVVTSIRYMLDVADRIRGNFSAQSDQWEQRAASYLAHVRAGRDPFVAARGRIVNRGYASPMTTNLQGYAIYLPQDYDPQRRYPLLLALHGGSSNGSLFLGVVLGNNMDWETYNRHLWDEFQPRWHPPMIVVAPDGYGQIMWRWMGEQDVFNVIEDVMAHYSVDPDQIMLSGLSNGGVGAYAIGSRHAWRFAKVIAMAGAPSWLQYAGGSPLLAERQAMEPWSGIHLAMNTANTDFRFFHGRTDTGPMRPHFIDAYQEVREELGLPDNATLYDLGHDILYRVLERGNAFSGWATARRERRPREVHLVTGDYRANRQHWLIATRIDEYPRLARLHGVAGNDTLTIESENLRAFSIDMRDVPLEGANVTIRVDDREIFNGPRSHLGHVLHVARHGDVWRTGFPLDPEEGLFKRPGLSGPLTDPYYERMVHVYGSQQARETEALRSAARQGARGWPVWLWHFEQEVVADTDVDEALMKSAHLVLYGNSENNRVLAEIVEDLPIRVEGGTLHVGDRSFEGPDVGARFVYPNPRAPNRYVIVQTGTSTSAVSSGHNLPDFLPDYLVYDRQTTRNRQRLMTGRNRPLALGYFDARWRLQ